MNSTRPFTPFLTEPKVWSQLELLSHLLQDHKHAFQLTKKLCNVASRVVNGKLSLSSTERTHFNRYPDVVNNLIDPNFPIEGKCYQLLTFHNLLLTLYARTVR